MAYSVTGMNAASNVGFRCETRHTAQGAKDLATAFIVAGMQEVEIRDDRGNLRSARDLDGVVPSNGADHFALARRLAAR